MPDQRSNCQPGSGTACNVTRGPSVDCTTSPPPSAATASVNVPPSGTMSGAGVSLGPSSVAICTGDEQPGSSARPTRSASAAARRRRLARGQSSPQVVRRHRIAPPGSPPPALPRRTHVRGRRSRPVHSAHEGSKPYAQRQFFRVLPRNGRRLGRLSFPKCPRLPEERGRPRPGTGSGRSSRRLWQQRALVRSPYGDLVHPLVNGAISAELSHPVGTWSSS